MLSIEGFGSPVDAAGNLKTLATQEERVVAFTPFSGLLTTNDK